MDYLNRRMAPFGEDIWKRIDEAAVNAARDLLTGRRFLEVDGPYGVGLTSVEVGHDDFCRQPTPEEAGAVMGRAISVPMLRKELRLSIRRIAAYSDMGQPLNLNARRGCGGSGGAARGRVYLLWPDQTSVSRGY